MIVQIKKSLLDWREKMDSMRGGKDIAQLSDEESEEISGQDWHIDQVTGFRNILRSRWLAPAAFIFELWWKEVPPIRGLVPRLVFWLFDANAPLTIPPALSRGWLKKHSHYVTPPSLFYLTPQHFSEYKRLYQLKRLKPTRNMKYLFQHPEDLVFLSRQSLPPTAPEDLAVWQKMCEYKYTGQIEVLPKAAFERLYKDCGWVFDELSDS